MRINIHNRNRLALSLLTIVLAFAAALLYIFYYPGRIGPQQPVPFSHRVHATDKNISCYLCHEGAVNSARAGVPPLETCMLCHNRIIIHHPEIEKLRAHYTENRPVEWKKIYNLPDYVFFNHSVHIFRKIDCAECHGNVKQMDRVERAQEFKMKFCIDCHKKNNASTDCFKCHR